MLNKKQIIYLVTCHTTWLSGKNVLSTVPTPSWEAEFANITNKFIREMING